MGMQTDELFIHGPGAVLLKRRILNQSGTAQDRKIRPNDGRPYLSDNRDNLPERFATL